MSKKEYNLRMAQIENIRHSLAHILAIAVKKKFPDVKLGIGPVIENGFYYDFLFPAGKAPNEADLPEIEAEMKEIIKEKRVFSEEKLPIQKIRELFKDEPFKLELTEELEKKSEEVTIYSTRPAGTIAGFFTDLCRGGHVENTSEIDPDGFKLAKIAGAYWRGNGKNPMLTRIYGLAFQGKKELDGYLVMLAEAEKRDHKILGPALDLFAFSDLVGPGLPLWTPKGTLIRNLLDNFVWELRKRRGYEKVEIPHITKKDLYEVSGHWDKFKDELFRITSRDEHEFAMKPMNCPHHTQIYARRKWSYRELPQRYATTTMCYRDEQTGELSGLSRVRGFTQDDAHVFCREEQTKEEFLKIWDIVHEFYKAFGFKMRVRLSLHDPEHPEKYLGGKERWEKAENILREIAWEKKAETFLGAGEAAFYGPKLDFMAKDSLGREWQVATIQLDMNMPERFDLTCVNEKNKNERIVMIHAAIMGSIERFVAILIEHYGGAFPLWLSPAQVALLPISEKHENYATKIKGQLQDQNVRVEIFGSGETIGKRIREAETQKVPYVAVLGDKEIETGNISVRGRGGNDLGAKKIEDFLEILGLEIIEKN